MFLHPRIRAREIRSFARQVGTLALSDRLDSRPIDQIRDRQLKLLRHILLYAYDSVPLYRRRFDAAGLEPSSIRSLEDFSRVPILTKDQILGDYPDGIVAQGYGRDNSFRCRSSGTSGVEGEYLSDWRNRDENFALLYRLRSHFGYRPKHLECVFAFLEAKKHWYQGLGFLPKVDIMMDREPAEVIEELAALSPDIVWGVPTYIEYLVSHVDSIPVSLLFVLSSGELLDPETKEELSQAFGCPIVDFYGAAEAPYVSSECPLQDGQHVNMLNTLIEIQKGGQVLGPGEMGSITVTTLTNLAMPLIRYDIGDVGTMSPDECPCGRRGDMLASIEGRRDDFVKTLKGPKPPMMARMAVTHPDVRGYRIIQESLDRVVLEIMGKLDEGSRATIAGRLRTTMENPDLQVVFEEVDEIRPDPSGKRRVVVCKA